MKVIINIQGVGLLDSSTWISLVTMIVTIFMTWLTWNQYKRTKNIKEETLKIKQEIMNVTEITRDYNTVENTGENHGVMAQEVKGGVRIVRK